MHDVIAVPVSGLTQSGPPCDKKDKRMWRVEWGKWPTADGESKQSKARVHIYQQMVQNARSVKTCIQCRLCRPRIAVFLRFEQNLFVKATRWEDPCRSSVNCRPSVNEPCSARMSACPVVLRTYTNDSVAFSRWRYINKIIIIYININSFFLSPSVISVQSILKRLHACLELKKCCHARSLDQRHTWRNATHREGPRSSVNCLSPVHMWRHACISGPVVVRWRKVAGEWLEGKRRGG